jgi:hypothetical protein
MSHLRRFTLAAGFAGILPALSACQPLPHPFADDHLGANAPLLAVPDAVGIVVAPVRGAPAPADAALTRGMVAGLQNAEIPASTASGNAHSYHLTGDAGGVAASGVGTIDWVLKDSSGKTVGEDRQQIAVDAASWQAGGTALADLGKDEAPRLAAMIQAPAPVAQVSMRQIYIRPVTGAPGDGDQSLPRSMTYLMRQAGIAVATAPTGPDTVTVAGTVAVAPAPNNQQQVTVAWQIIDPAGKNVGKISQSNTVPTGTLNGPWSDIAMAVASAAFDDVNGLIKDIPEPSAAP